MTKRVEIIEVRFLDYGVCQCNQGCKYNILLKNGSNGYTRSMVTKIREELQRGKRCNFLRMRGPVGVLLGTGNLYYSYIYRLHGLPDFVTSDEVLTLSTIFGPASLKDLKSRYAYRLLTILSQMDKPKVQTKSWNNICVRLSPINKMIDRTGSPVQNFLQIITPHHLSRFPPFFFA